MSTARTGGILIASTRAAAGVYEDQTAPIVADWLAGHGFTVLEPVIVPDGEAVGSALKALLTLGPSVVVTSGGTGLSPDDTTPETTAPLLDRQIPGIQEAIRAAGLVKTPHAALSRGLAGAAGSTFVVNLPGSPRGVRDALGVLDPMIDHICRQLEGHRDH
ncbi:MogA/MoaB family molybdenum cofactor biosynthesis protein [Zhihengliuella sp.]|uniref:MogA/MoaB family molybdenum cofactor biosynthesis protein n=1 Tax=Zhihengliuella sp. TaxID=1954483 RepID=UPI002811BF87|nr:MogA/MoaB family molybdenum cofactor biosynthesis protein [Zhihengliuella sp.]